MSFSKDLKEDLYLQQIVLPTLFIISVFRYMEILLVQRPLSVDEAQYWLWSQHLALGYHSKPPMIAYLVRISTAIFGNNIFGIKFFMPLSHAITTLFIYLATKKISNVNIATFAAISFFISLGVSFSSTILSTDPIMLMFWSMGFYYLCCVLEDNLTSAWLQVGFFVALSILSKYTGALFLLSTLILFFVDKPSRRILATPYVYLALILILLMLTPNIYWNLITKHSAFSHVLHENIGVSEYKFQLHPLKLLEFVGSQFAVISPVLFPIILYGLFSKRSLATSSRRLLWSFSFPIFFIFCLQSLARFSYANWAVAMYISAIPLAYLLIEKTILLKKVMIVHLGFGLFGLTFLALYDYVSVKEYLPHRFIFKTARESLPWPKLAKYIKKYRKANFLFDDRGIWSRATYYGGLDLQKVYTWPAKSLDGFTSFNHAKGKDFVYASFSEDIPKSIKRCFASTQFIEKASTTPEKKVADNYLYFYKLVAFKGSLCF